MPFVLFLVFMIIVISFIIYYEKKRKAYKRDVVDVVLKSYFDDYEYHFEEGLSKSRVQDTKLVRCGNIYQSDDYIRSSYKGVEFEFSDVRIKKRVKTGKHTTTITYFSGQWIIIKNKIKLQAPLYVVDRNLSSSMAQNSSLFETSIPKVELESIEFNQEFHVYTNHAHDAFYVLTPDFIEKLIAIHREDVSFYISGEEIHIAIYSRENLFEPNVFEENTVEAKRDQISKKLDQTLKYIKLFSEGNLWRL